MKQKPVWRMEPDVVHGGWSVFKTIRTKAAKYELVGCGACQGVGMRHGFYTYESTGLVSNLFECEECNGKGYRLTKCSSVTMRANLENVEMENKANDSESSKG